MANTETSHTQNSDRKSEISDTVFLSLHQAAKMTGYHQDYLGQMARSGKLEARKVGRNWQTTKHAIDKMLGRVPSEDQEQRAAVSQPATADQPATVRPSDLPKRFEPVLSAASSVQSQQPQPKPQPAVSRQSQVKISKQPVVVRRLENSPAAGPNLQEALAFEMPATLLPTAIRGTENKNIFYRLNKLTHGHAWAVAAQSAPEKYLRAKKLSDDILAEKNSQWAGRVMAIAFCVVLVAAAYGGWNFLKPNSTTDNQMAGTDNVVQTDLGAQTGQAAVQLDKMVAGESTTAAQLRLNQGPGQGTVFAGKSETVVNHPGTEINSIILVTFRDDYGGRYWVSDQRAGQFTVKLSGPAIQDIKFDYWVVDQEQRDPP